MNSFIIAITSSDAETFNSEVVAVGTTAALKQKLKDQAFLESVSKGNNPVLAIVAEKNQFAVIPHTTFMAIPIEETTEESKSSASSAPVHSGVAK